MTWPVSTSTRARAVRRARHARAAAVAAAVAALLALATLAPTAGPAVGATDPPGNNGTVKVAELGDLDDPPDNDPHVGCTFTVEWYGFDEGDDIISEVSFEMQAPTRDVALQVTGPAQVFVGGDPASGAGTATGLDGREVYTLAFRGDPQPQQGYHVKLTVDTPGSTGSDQKSKVFWVQGCQVQPDAPAIHLEKTVADSDGDSVGTPGEKLVYTMTVTNTGDTVLEQVLITDAMLGLDGALCVETLAPGESTTCPRLPDLVHVVTADDVEAGSVSNVATASGTPPSGAAVTDVDDATIATAAAVVPPADLALVKTADVSLAAPGDTVTYRLRAVNSGLGTARDVVVTDTLPAGTTYVSASGGCSAGDGTVTCRLGDIEPAGETSATVTVSIDTLPSAITAHDHQLDVTKIESHLSVPAGATAAASSQCPSGDVATDGTARLDHVDQGTGTFDDAVVLASLPTSDGRGWTGTVRNESTGQLQAKVIAVCMSDHTVSGEDHSHPVEVSDPLTTTRALAVGTSTVDLACGPGTVAIAPGFAFDAGDGVVTSRSVDGARRFTVRMEHDGQVTLTTRCLSTELGVVRDHTHRLAVTELTGHADVGAHAVEERTLTCRNGAKGIVAWVDFGGDPLGTDPMPVTRLFRFYNPTDAPLAVDYGLTCIDVRTSTGDLGTRDIENTARVSTSSPDTATFDDTSTATVSVTPTGLTAARSGVLAASGGAISVQVTAARPHAVRLVLVATHRVRGAGIRPGTVLASGATRIVGADHTVRLTTVRDARSALRAGQVDRARLILRSHGTRQAQMVRLR